MRIPYTSIWYNCKFSIQFHRVLQVAEYHTTFASLISTSVCHTLFAILELPATLLSAPDRLHTHSRTLFSGFWLLWQMGVSCIRLDSLKDWLGIYCPSSLIIVWQWLNSSNKGHNSWWATLSNSFGSILVLEWNCSLLLPH
jgi:hypothetical protein